MPLDNENNKSNAPLDQEQLGEQVKQLDEDLAALRARFDQFFLGLDKKNPQKDLDDLRKRMLKLKREFVRNTGLKFRIQTLHAKFLSYERLWLKSLKEIEEGTYSRDLFKLRRKKGHQEDKGAKKPAAAADDGKKKEKKDSWSLEDLEAELPDELFGEPQGAGAPPPPAKPLQRQKTDPALPDEVGGIGSGPRPQSPPPPPSGAVAPARPVSPTPVAARPPPPPPAAVAAGPIPRQPSKPPQAPSPLPRQQSGPPMPPLGAVAGTARPAPPAAARPPAPPPGATARPPAPPAAAVRPPPPPAGAAGPGGSGEGLSQDKVKKIYDAFVTAKKRCKESTDGITLEAVEQSLRKQVPQLMKEHGAKSVDFKVVIKDGKAVLKAVPK